MANGPTTDAIIEVLQSNSGQLIAENFIESMSYAIVGRPLKITLQHTIDPSSDGKTYRLKTVISYGCRVSKSQEQTADFSSLSKPSKFPLHSVPLSSAAA